MPFSHETLLSAVTNLGDSSVISAVVIASALYLAITGSWKDACAVVLSLLVTSLIIASLKILLISCHFDYLNLDLNSPSGHAAITTAVFGTLAFIVSQRVSGKWQTLPLIVAGIVICAVAASRTLLGFHSIADVAVGLFIGASLVWLLRRYVLRTAPHTFNVYILLLAIIAAVILCHGHNLPAEEYIRKLAHWLSPSFAFCKK